MDVKKNTVINLTGSIAPMLISLITVPAYLHKIGDSRYGILAIVWLALGYFGLFDLGLSRATSNQIAKHRDAPPEVREKIFWTAFVLNILFGTIGGAMLYAFGRIVFNGVFTVPVQMQNEIQAALPWLAVAVPIATASGVLTGSLEGRSRFSTVNIIQVFGTILFLVMPLAVAYYHGPGLDWLIPSAVLARVIASVPLVWAVIRHLPLSRPQKPSGLWIRALFGYGAWVTVTNLVGPVLDTLDRFLVGATIGIRAVTYYTIPFTMANRVNVLPSALSRTIFPLLSFETETNAREMAKRAMLDLSSVLTPIVVVGIFIMRPFLNIWVGTEIAIRAAPVGEVVLIGAWMNGLAYIPYGQLQSQSHPDLVAKYHLLELVPFVGILWVGLRLFGLVGGAAAWTLRVTVDAVLLSWAAGFRWQVLHSLWIAIILVCTSCMVAWLMPFPNILGLILGVTLALTSICWSWMFNPQLRKFVFKAFSSLFRRWSNR